MFQVRFHGRGGQGVVTAAAQARYAHLFRPQERTEVIERLQASADRNIARFGLLEDQKPAHIERTRLTLASVHDSDQRQ